MKPIVLTFCSLFSTVTLHKIRTFLHILDDEPMKTFGSGQSSIIIEHKIKDFAGLRPYLSSMFTPLKIAEFHNCSPLLISFILNAYVHVNSNCHLHDFTLLKKVSSDCQRP